MSEPATTSEAEDTLIYRNDTAPCEQVVVFGKQSPLIGILTTPTAGPEQSLPAFIILNSGLIHRVGPNGQNTRLARSLASRGFPVLRFDHSGVGDSPPARDSRSIPTRWTDEIREAIDFLQESVGIRQVAVLGNCSGASGVFLAAVADARVTGAALINPPIVGTGVRYYFRLMVSNPRFWARLFGRHIRLAPTLQTLMDRIFSHGTLPEEYRPSREGILQALVSLTRRGTRLLIVSCQWDPSYDIFYRGRMGRELLDRADKNMVDLELIRGANHDFSLLRNQSDLMNILLEWAEGFRSPGTASTPGTKK